MSVGATVGQRVRYGSSGATHHQVIVTRLDDGKRLGLRARRHAVREQASHAQRLLLQLQSTMVA